MLPELKHLHEAAERLAGVALRTPLVENHDLNRMTGGRVLMKLESLQRTGSFKFRGAYNRLSQLSEAERDAGVFAYSSGNHAQGVAAAAAELGLPATILMPSDAPAIKLARTRRSGAEVVFYDRWKENREELAARRAREVGATLIAPYDDAAIIAGQGTVGLELVEDARAMGVDRLDAVAIPCGGGGLSAGCAIALAALSPDTAVHTVEPESFDGMRRSLVKRERVFVEDGRPSICDALMAPMPGVLTLEANLRHGTRPLAVGDDEVRSAMAIAFAELKLVLEPGGAAALAAVLSGRIDVRGRVVALVCSGANVDPDVYAAIIRDTATPPAA